METLVSNRARGPTRRVTENGREYLVAPLTMIVPGVLAGSAGALFYPPDEIARNAGVWEGVPLTLGHPYDRDGNAVPARATGVLDRQGLGTVRKPTATADGRLRAEGWFDVRRTRRAHPHLVRSLERGDRIELSTGLYTSNEPAPPGASHFGRPYDFIARNYRPDHLAVLVDQRGACSVSDGCGVNNCNGGNTVSNHDEDDVFELTLNDDAGGDDDFVADLTRAQDDKYARDKANLDRSIAETDEDIREEENKRRLGLFDDPPPEGDPLALTTENERYGAGFEKGDRVQFPSPSGKTWRGTIVWLDHDTRLADIQVDGKETLYAGVQIAKLKPAPGSLSLEARHDLTMSDPDSELSRENQRRLVGNRYTPGDDPLPIPEL